MKKVLFFSMLTCAFVACGGGNVDKVKNATLRGYDTMTISAAIEGSKICASIKYEDVSKNGLNAVKIICTESNEQIAGRNAKLEENYNVELEKYNENVKRYEKALKDAIEKNKKDRDVAIARLQDTLKKSFTKSLSYDEILKISMDNCKADAKNMTKCNDDGILSALKAAGVEESKTGFWTLKSLPSNFASVFGYHDEVLTLASRDAINAGFFSIYKPKEAPSKPEAIKTASREISFIIKPDNTVEPKKDDFFVVVDGKKEKSSYRILSEFYKR